MCCISQKASPRGLCQIQGRAALSLHQEKDEKLFGNRGLEIAWHSDYDDILHLKSLSLFHHVSSDSNPCDTGKYLYSWIRLKINKY